jgi:hypothetical protein
MGLHVKFFDRLLGRGAAVDGPKPLNGLSSAKGQEAALGELD